MFGLRVGDASVFQIKHSTLSANLLLISRGVGRCWRVPHLLFQMRNDGSRLISQPFTALKVTLVLYSPDNGLL